MSSDESIRLLKSDALRTVAMSAMHLHGRIQQERISDDDLISDMGVDIELGFNAIIRIARRMLHEVYSEPVTSADEALDLLEEIAAIDNEWYAAFREIRSVAPV